MEEVPLEGAAAGAVGTGVRPAYEERVGAQVEDVVDARSEVSSATSSRSADPAGGFCPAHGPKSDGPVIDELDGGRERRPVAIDVGRPSSAATERAVAAARSRAGPSGRSSA